MVSKNDILAEISKLGKIAANAREYTDDFRAGYSTAIRDILKVLQPKTETNQHLILADINTLYCNMSVTENYSAEFVQGYKSICDDAYNLILVEGGCFNGY